MVLLELRELLLPLLQTFIQVALDQLRGRLLRDLLVALVLLTPL